MVRFIVYYEGEHVHDSQIKAITCDHQIVDEFRHMLDESTPEPPDEPSRLKVVEANKAA